MLDFFSRRNSREFSITIFTLSGKKCTWNACMYAWRIPLICFSCHFITESSVPALVCCRKKKVYSVCVCYAELVFQTAARSIFNRHSLIYMLQKLIHTTCCWINECAHRRKKNPFSEFPEHTKLDQKKSSFFIADSYYNVKKLPPFDLRQSSRFDTSSWTNDE